MDNEVWKVVEGRLQQSMVRLVSSVRMRWWSKKAMMLTGGEGGGGVHQLSCKLSPKPKGLP